MTEHRRLAIAFVVTLCTLAPSRAQPPRVELTIASLRPLETLGRDLMRFGRRAETQTLLELMTQLGYPDKQLPGLKKSLEAVKRDDKLKPEALLKSFDTALAAAKGEVAKLEGDAQKAAAALLLEIDGSIEAAHKALDHQLVGPYWLPPDQVAMRARSQQMLEAVRLARRLEIPIQSGECKDAYLTAVLGRAGSEAKSGKLTLRTPWAVPITERVLRETLRATALAHWLDTGTLEPKVKDGRVVYMFDVREDFTKAAKVSLDQNGISDNEYNVAKDYGLQFKDTKGGFHVDQVRSEGQMCAELLVDCARNEQRLFCLDIGRLNWASLQVIGMPATGYGERFSSRVSERFLEDEPQSDKLPEGEGDFPLLHDAGLGGGRAWLGYLARKRNDPPFSRGFRSSVSGDKLTKTTTVFEYLHQANLWDRLKTVTFKMDRKEDQIDPTEDLEKALGFPLTKLEERWRDWISPADDSLRARIAALCAPPPAGEPKEVLDLVNKQRTLALSGAKGLPPPWPVRLDPDLCYGAQLHARYLRANPDQLAWPACQEELPDKSPTPEGAWAAPRSLIAVGCKTPRDAIDTWMASVANRVRLLDPGVVRIGYARDGDIIVLDVESHCRPRIERWFVPWPFEDQKNVPVAATRLGEPPTLPNADGQKLGYVISLQLGADKLRPMRDLQMKLYEMARGSKTEVACLFGSPGAPLNPAAVPSQTFVLIPKAPLKSGAEYRVEADFVGEKMAMAWTFRTGG